MTKEISQLPPASWIWAQRPVDMADTMAQFRLEFDWDGAGEVFWEGFADTLYTIWCNGVCLGVGPVASTIQEPFVSRWDLDQHAHPGRNVLAIQVWTHANRRDCSDYCALEGGLIGWLRAGETVIPTGPDWLARDAVGYSMPAPDQPFRPFQESRLVWADLRREPMDWMKLDFHPNSEEWQSARVVHPGQHPKRKSLRPCPLPNFTCERLPAPKLMDAGWAIGDAPVKFVRDVADRMIGQEHKSLLCPAIELGRPFAGKDIVPSTARGLPNPARMGWESLEPPIRLPQPETGRDFYLTYDLGRQTSGCLLLTVETETECRIEIGYTDRLRKRRVNPTVQFNLSDRVIVPAAGRSEVRLPHDRGCRYIQLSFSRAAIVQEIAWEEHVFAHDRTRRFHSSDPGLNAIWEAAENTIRQVSLSFYTDNARRERQGWMGTELIHTGRGGFAVYGDLALARKQIVDALECAEDLNGYIPAQVLGNIPLEWQREFDSHDLCVPQTFRDYIQRSDDRELAPHLLEASMRMIEYHMNIGEKGLKERIGSWCWTGWTFVAATSVITGHNLLLIEAMRATADLHRYLGNEKDAEKLAAREAPLIAAIFRELLDPERGVLCQGLDPEGNRVPFCSQADNARALLLGIVPKEKIEHFHRFAAGPSGSWPTNRSAWQSITSRGDIVRYHPEQAVVAGSPFDSLLAVDTIAALESPQAALNYIRYNFGAMVDEGEGTLWECWNQHSTTIDSACYSQGWGTAVAYQMLQYIVGAQFIEPGGTVIEWRPRRVDVRELSARIATTQGDVTLGWRGDELHWSVPEGVTVRIHHGSDKAAQDLVGPTRNNV